MKPSKHDQGVIKDEADAEMREGERQAEIEREPRPRARRSWRGCDSSWGCNGR